MTPSVLCAALEIALNRYLQLEPDVLAACGQLRGRVIALSVTTMAWTFFLEFHEAGVRVSPALEQAPDVSVSGSLPVLIRQAFKLADGQAGLPQSLTVEGDTALLMQFNALLARVGFDPEEIAAKMVGDTAAHRLVQGLEKFLGWSRRSAHTVALDTAEYLREETRDLARREDVEEWMDAVDGLREATDRLEARIARLEPA